MKMKLLKRANTDTVPIEVSEDTETVSSEEGEYETDKDMHQAELNVKKKKYERKFQNSLLSESIFKDCLEKQAGVPYCKFFDCKLSCTKTVL